MYISRNWKSTEVFLSVLSEYNDFSLFNLRNRRQSNVYQADYHQKVQHFLRQMAHLSSLLIINVLFSNSDLLLII